MCVRLNKSVSEDVITVRVEPDDANLGIPN